MLQGTGAWAFFLAISHIGKNLKALTNEVKDGYWGYPLTVVVLFALKYGSYLMRHRFC